MWTITIKTFEKGTDIFLNTVSFVGPSKTLVEDLRAFSLDPETWASFSIVNPAGKEKGNGVVTSINSIIYTLQQITIPKIEQVVNMDLEDFYAGKCSL